jgi:hypothetical protein
MVMQRLFCATLLSGFLVCVAGQGYAQGPETVGTLILGAQALKSTLDSTLANAGVEGRSIVGSVNGTIDGTIDQLRNLVNNDLSKPVNQLTGTAQAVATQLHNTVDDLNQAVSLNLSCGLEGVERLVYTVKTLTSGLQNALPLIKDGKPYLYSFTFEGQHPGIVPRDGGRLSIEGFSLWPSTTPPNVTLVSEPNRTQIKALTSGRAASNDAVSVVMDKPTITSLAGQCAEFEVTPRTVTGIWPFRHDVALPPLYLPICVPKSLTTAIRIIVKSSFQCLATDAPHPLTSQVFRCDNSSCENRGGCNVQKSWTLPAGCTIVSTNVTPGGNIKDTDKDTVPITHVGGNYSASGTINTASCSAFGGGLFPAGNHLNHSTIWEVNVSPVVQCTSQTWLPASDVSSPAQTLSSNALPLCVDIPSSCGSPSTSSYTASVQLFDANTPQGTDGHHPDPLASFNTETVTAPGTATQGFKNTSYEGLQFQGTANPNAGGHAQVCITAKLPQCNF